MSGCEREKRIESLRRVECAGRAKRRRRFGWPERGLKRKAPSPLRSVLLLTRIFTLDGSFARPFPLTPTLPKERESHLPARRKIETLRMVPNRRRFSLSLGRGLG